jgi:hypothetical protein
MEKKLTREEIIEVLKRHEIEFNHMIFIPLDKYESITSDLESLQEEKKALIGIFKKVCRTWDIALGACKGYPSLTFLYELHNRFDEAIEEGKRPIILYFGDYDPSGEDIPRSIKDNLDWFGIEVEIRRIALMEHQVSEWKLPSAPIKSRHQIIDERTGKLKWMGDTRSIAWEGIGQVELDAVPPEEIINLCENAIKDIFDEDLHDDLDEMERLETDKYVIELKEYVNKMKS